jgi:hypothetical protein
MKANQKFQSHETNAAFNRRDFIEKGFKITLASGVARSVLLQGCKEEEDEDKEVSPPEDLMQEHGVLKRVLLVYDACRIHLINKNHFQLKS